MFTPRHIKHSQLLLRHARKYLRYKHDKLSSADREQIVGEMQTLRESLRSKDRQKVHTAAETLDKTLHKLTPVTWESHWRENCEVILVAIVIAVGIRSYFLQPFKIPTGSMQPTLNGIIGHPTSDPPPNILRQIRDFVIRGRNYINVVSDEDDQIIKIVPKKIAFFFTFSRLVCERQKPSFFCRLFSGREPGFLVYAPPEQLRLDFSVFPGRLIHRGEVIARGAIDTGDQVFVDKCSYNFIKPRNGDVFVFRTNNIPAIPSDPIAGPPFYIKRLAGLPGDQLRIDPPSLYINGKRAQGYGFERVMSARPPYKGYSLGPEYLSKPDQIYTVPSDGYFALGDNSYNSSDSRFWGTVPLENLVGRGLFVYWPFFPHGPFSPNWGIIR
jgi:signal peptidase I